MGTTPVDQATNSISDSISNWLSREGSARDLPMSDYEQIRQELKPCDVLLVEGRSRISKVIQLLTHSHWSHAALYIGSIHDIKNQKLRQHIMNNYHGDIDEPLLIEGFLGKGTVVSPLAKYRTHHLRICRPNGLAREDAQKVICFCIGAIGYDYNKRQIFDLMRLLLPVNILPRTLFSTLYRHNKDHKQKICSSLLAEAFYSVRFPILPKVIINDKGDMELVPRNPNLFTPEDFDFSPYFNIIKYPLFGISDKAVYRNLPWNEKGLISNDASGVYDPYAEEDRKRQKMLKKQMKLQHKLATKIPEKPDQPETD